MEKLGPQDISFTFSAMTTPTMRPGASWLSFWILGVLCCEGLGQTLWIVSPPPAWLPAPLLSIPRPLVVGGALGLWQALLLFRWIRHGADWWVPTTVGVIVAAWFSVHPPFAWFASHALAGPTVGGAVMGLGQWLLLRATVRRSFIWVPASALSRAAAVFLASTGAALWRGPLARSPASTKLLALQGFALLGLTLTDGWALGALLRVLLGPGNRRGPKLRFPDRA